MKNVTIAMCFFASCAFAADEQTLTAPLTNTPISSSISLLNCDATLGTRLKAIDKNYSKITGDKAALYASAYRPTDRLVIELFDGNMYLHRRDDFDNGKTTRGSPLKIADTANNALFAFDYGPVLKGSSMIVVTLNRRTGVGIWTTTESNNMLSSENYPDAEAFLLSCSARKL